ncbi:hypothetical protein DY262_04155 [Hydrogenophaga borbori]|uniref:Uncharacterized protein n=1 Tax=Hydrogenophaga borbori TaxID=2294117 RepID=A0A372EMS7_9BURK|nr:hypothetical protein [Hydrogenophaga borbori]RFP80978.1 hypothetical protein DY262_04155 [Hydrogenophaga borbori]
MQRFSSFFFSNPKPPSIPRAEHKPLINRSGTEAADTPRPSSRNEANRRNARFLEASLNIQDQRVLAQATQALESTLNALLDSRPPVLRIWDGNGGWHCSATPTNAQQVEHLLHLGQFLLQHRQRSAVFVLSATVLQLKDPHHPEMPRLMLACGQAVRQVRGAIDPQLLQALQGLASDCAQANRLSPDELALFLSAEKDPPPHPAFDALLDQLGASAEQRRQALERDDLRQAFDTLQSGEPPALTVWNDGGCQHCLVPPGDERGGRFDQLAWFAHQLQALHIPGAANLLAALSLAAHHQGGKEIDLIERCGRALLDRLTQQHLGTAPPARSGALPHEVLTALCARVGELVARGALPAEWLQTFESIAQRHQAPGCVAGLRLRGITLDIQRLGAMGAAEERQALAARLVLDIQKVHRLLGANGLDGSGALALMRSLRAVCGNDAQAQAVQAALQAMGQKTPQQLALEQGIDDMREAMASWLPSFDKRPVDDAVRLYLSRDDAATPGLALQRQAQLLHYIEALADSPQAPRALIERLVEFTLSAFPAPTPPPIDSALRLLDRLDGGPLTERLTQLLKALPSGTPWTTPQRGRLIALVLRAPRPRATLLKLWLERGPLTRGTRTEQEAVGALCFGLNQLAKGTKPEAVMAHVLHTLDNSGVADVPEWRPLAQGLLIAWLEQDHSAARLQSPELLRFAVDIVMPPVEHTAVAEEACAELARALHPTLLRLDRREPSSRQAAPVELFGHALLQPAPQHLAPLQRPQGLGLLQAAWRALVPARPGTTTPLPATDRPATEPPPFAG